jgi:hypothetical protein
MLPTARLLRKKFPKEQLLIDGMFDEDVTRAIREAQDDAAFEAVDADVETQYCCPACGYEWSGRPKPVSRASDEKGVAS